MGSLCNSPTTTTQQYTPNPQAAGVYNSILSQAQNVAATPYQPYGGQLVAPVNQEQNTGISNINAAYGQAQPYINTAAGYAATGAAPVANVSANDIQQYMDPFTSQVVNATQNQFNLNNAQQQQSLLGNAAAQGALGGDRVGVTQAALAGQQQTAQAPVIAGLYNQGYGQAVNEANVQQQNQQANAQRAGNAAFTFGNLGTTAQSAGIQGAGAQIQAGGLQQQTQQAQDTAAYQQYLNQLAYPFQTLGWEAGIAGPIGGALGGTQTTTPPSPNPFSQYLGLALGAAATLRRGGRVGYADGGSTPMSAMNFIDGARGYVPVSPQIQIVRPQFGNVPGSNPNAAPTAQQASAGIKGLENIYGKMTAGSGAPTPLSSDGSGFTPSPVGSIDSIDALPAGTGLPGFGGFYAHGGVIEAMHHIRRGLRSRRYDDGGTVPFDSRWVDVPQSQAAVASPLPYVQDVSPQAMQDWRSGADAGAPLSNPSLAPPSALPPQIAGSGSALPSDALAYSPSPPAGISGAAAMPSGPIAQTSPIMSPMMAPAAAPPPPSSGGGLLSHLGINTGLTDEQRAGLLSAGLGIMAGTSPHGLTNIGTGGQQGVQAMQQYRQEQFQKQQAQEAQALSQQKVQLEAQKLQQQIDQFSKTQALEREMHFSTTPYQQSELELKKQQLAQTQQYQQQEMAKPVVIGQNMLGQQTYGIRDKSGAITPLDPNTGQPVKPGAPGATAPNSPDAGDAAAASGASGVLAPNVGPLPPTAENMAKMIAGYQIPPLSGFALKSAFGQAVMSRVYELKNDYSAQDYGASNAAVKAFNTGKQGDQVRFFNNSVQHLSTLDNLITAMNNGDTRAVNALSNMVKEQFGGTAPATFDAAKQIVGQEVVKSIVANGGGEREREEAAATLSAARSPEQLRSIIETYKELAGAQLRDLKLQYQNGTKRTDFESKLIPEAQQQLKQVEARVAARGAPATTSPTISPEDRQQALEWLSKNPTDARAAKIRQRLGIQ